MKLQTLLFFMRINALDVHTVPGLAHMMHLNILDPNGTVEKCTLCTNRLNEGLKPACSNLCPTGALDFGEISPV